MIHRLQRGQSVPAGLEEVWAYFSVPENLNELTPPDMHFRIISNTAAQMAAGQLIEYRVRFMPVVRSRWLTEIAHVRELAYFVDEQRIGPYRFWHHQHHFEPIPGGTRNRDEVTYELPFGGLGDLVHAVWVRRRLNHIFDYRQQKIAELFGRLLPIQEE